MTQETSKEDLLRVILELSKKVDELKKQIDEKKTPISLSATRQLSPVELAKIEIQGHEQELEKSLDSKIDTLVDTILRYAKLVGFQ